MATSDLKVALIGFAGSVVAALALIINTVVQGKISRSKQRSPSGQEVLLQARRFALPVFTLGIAVTALVVSLWPKASISFDEYHTTQYHTIEKRTSQVVIKVPEGQEARVIVIGSAAVDSDSLNNYQKTDVLPRFGLDIKITGENDQFIAEGFEWMPMFVPCHDKQSTGQFSVCPTGTIPLKCSASGAVKVTSGEHTFYWTTLSDNTAQPVTVTLSYFVVFTPAAK